MAQQRKPLEWTGFRGIHLSGNPAKRPIGTASKCNNYRIMPDGWLRMRSGRVALAAPADVVDMGEIIEFMPFRANSTHGSSKHLIRAMVGANPTYWELDMSDWSVTLLSGDALPSEMQGIRRSLGFVSLEDGIVYGNGFGTRNSGSFPASSATRSIPWLTRWDPTNGRRFFGLFYHQNATADRIYIPSLKRTLPPSGLGVVVDGTGLNYNTIDPAAPVNLYAGLHNTRSGHYSNGAVISVGLSTTGAQTVHITGVANVQAPYHSTDERDEIKIVFYATLPGGGVPYLIMNSSLDGPFTVDYGTSSTVDLSISSLDTTGWVVDKTKEMPVNSYPPRQMRDICYAGGRMFGIPFNYDAVQQSGYEYEILQSDMSGVCWSYSYGDQRRIQFAGNPLESWDPTRFSPCPSGERPLRCVQAPDGISVVVLTASQTYLLREQSDGLMEWVSISTSHGINSNSLRSLAVTRRGICWVTQRNQIAMIGVDLNLRIISGEYDALIRRKNILCGGFVYDPANEVERYEIFWLETEPADVVTNWGGVFPCHSLCHDFMTGEAYTTTDSNLPVTAIGELSDGEGQTWNLMAGMSSLGKAELYAREGIPGDPAYYRVPTFDEDITTRSPLTITDREIPDASYESNWFTPDMSQRTNLVNVDLMGDVSESTQLSKHPVSIEAFTDFNAVVEDSGQLLSLYPIESLKVPSTDNNYARYRTVDGFAIHWKLRIKHAGHSTDQGDYYPQPDEDGSSDTNFYGAILDMKVLFGEGVNRL